VQEEDDDDFGKPMILVADDEPEMRRFLTSQLKHAYAVREARNGSEALDLAQSNNFILILLDLMMPGIDGITLTRALRDEKKTAGVPVIMLTARADDHSKMQALEAGVTDFLTKPFSSSELMVRCRNLILQQQLQQSLARKSRELEAALIQIKETESQLVHQAKMASLGQLSSGLMHEINNPLNFANTASFLLQKRLSKIAIEDRTPIDKPLKDLQDGIKRVSDIVGSLRSFIHPDTSGFGPVSLKEVVDTSLRFVQIDSSQIKVHVAVDESLQVWGNGNQLIHLLINLLQNSTDSLREKGTQDKTVKIEASLQNGRVVLALEDNGKGIKPEIMDKIFDAFFTTKPVGSGVGLGLNICYRIVQNHEGDIRVESKEDEYCRFIITLKPTSSSI
jgi:C4-dicarboxylate-specific signal transduction histidine kinase